MVAHRAPGTQPFPIGNLRQRWVETVDMVGGSAGVAAQQLASVFTHPAELHVVIVLFLRTGGNPKADLRYHSILAVLLKILKFLILCFPLDSFFFLRDKSYK